jgi:hypothetical protein
MQLTGHKTRAVFERYNIVSARDSRVGGTQRAGLLTAVLSYSLRPANRKHRLITRGAYRIV